MNTHDARRWIVRGVLTSVVVWFVRHPLDAWLRPFVDRGAVRALIGVVVGIAITVTLFMAIEKPERDRSAR